MSYKQGRKIYPFSTCFWLEQHPLHYFDGERMKKNEFFPWGIVATLFLMAVVSGAQAEDPKAMKKKPFRIIDAVCDFESREIAAEKWQLVCQYVCRDPDHSKMFQVYANSSFGKCPTPIKTKIKQTIKEEKKAAPPPAH